jgi:hypothetical protein
MMRDGILSSTPSLILYAEAYPYEIVQWFQLFLCIVLKKDCLYIFDFIYFEALYTNDR